MEYNSAMLRLLTIVLLASTGSVPVSIGQMPGRVPMAHGGLERGARIGPRHGTHPFARGIVLGSPFFYPDYYPTEPFVVESSPPQVVVVQPAAEDSTRKAPSRPLLIEWRGKRYVRFGGSDESRESNVHRDYAEPPMSAKTRNKPRETDLPSAVLVYRGGHREEISDYVIAGNNVCIHGDYWHDGFWIKGIPLSELDLPATMQVNQQRGIRFMLPSSPNVVTVSF